MTTTSYSFPQLTPTVLYEIMKARQEVFTVEQEILYNDLDDVDFHAWHTCVWHEGHVVCYARTYCEESGSGVVHIGRVLTAKDFRRQHIATRVMQEALKVAAEQFNAAEVMVHAQSYIVDFYKSLGFVVCSDEFIEADIPHYAMRLTLA